MKRILILSFSLLFSNLYAQGPKSFSSDRTIFIKEMGDFLKSTNKKEAEKILDIFEPMWAEGKFSGDQQMIISQTANNMLKKRLKAFPDFSNYLEALMGFTHSGRDMETFKLWNNSLDKMLGATSRRYSDYLEICSGLFVSNTLYQSSSTEWIAGTGNYTFEFDTIPRIVFPSMDLICKAKNDSCVIYGIKGYYDPLKKIFNGVGGKVLWTRAGLEPTTTYAELKKSAIDVTGSDWSADSAILFNKKYFKDPLIGKVTDKLLANVTIENASYPRFDSYNLGLGIKELIKDADYVGGFSLHGSKMIGSGTKEEKATLIFKRNNKPFLIARARSFVVRPERISSDNASVCIYWDKDSIYHPSLQLKYVNKERELSLIREPQSGISMPFFNSFHQVDMYVDAIYWKIDDPLMELKMLTGAGESKMVLESSKLYTDERFQKIQGLADVSPLFTLKQYAEKNNRDIYSPDLAKALRTSEQQARALLIFLANKGFVAYDFDEDKATVSDKLYYYLSARSNKTDFDKIEIESIISAKSNGKLSLLNFDLDLQGVSRIILSDSQQVYIVPTEQQLKLEKNRDFEFSGRVHAGRSDLYGKKFKFRYDDFKIDLTNVDSIRLKVVSENEFDENGNPKLIPLKSTLQNVSGTLSIDSAMNKSSRKNYPGYPAFTSDKESYVYYDNASIFNGVYKRDKFYFKMEPFTIDSLDNFAAGGLQFAGEFESAGIFPTIKEVAKIRPDYSFGFERNSPNEGYSMYGGKGKFTNHIDLSFKGLIGNGTIDYLSSTSQSEKIFFFPDSTNADSSIFALRKETISGISYPQAEGKMVYLNWVPKKDQMFVFKLKENLNIYEKQVSLDGNLVLTNKGLRGNGNSLFSESELFADDFYFKQDAYGADTSDFKLKSDDEKVLAIQTKNVKSRIDLVKRFGEFVSNGKGSYVSFPLNEYICFIAQFKWFIDKQEVEFGEDYKDNTKLNIEGSDFVSVNPMQDSLRWNAGLARYSLIDYLIKARKVKEILVADASIQPKDTATIVIERNANMRPLKDANIIANTSTKYHTITNSTVKVLGRKSYTAEGLYAYTDQTKVKHLITLDRIAIDTSLQTFANGTIPDSSNFLLSTNIQYKGKVNITAANPLLNFDGFARVNHSCSEKLKTSWFSFRSDIDPKGVNIPIEELRNENMEKLSVSISIASDSSGFYSSFLSPKVRTSDPDLITAKGFLSYDEKNRQYKVGSKEKLISPEEPGNLISLNDANCTIYGEGRLNLGTNYGQFATTVVGNVINNTNNDSTVFDVFMGLDFMFNDDALKTMIELIQTNPSLQPTVDTRTTWTRGMKELIGTERADKLISEFNLYGAPKKIPQELHQTIFLTDLKLDWNKETQSYKSKGMIGVGFINKTTISRMLKGSLEIQRKKGGDNFNLYLESDNANWWYFNYSRGIMQVISSDSQFNDAIQKMKPDKRVADTKGDKAPYEFMLSTDRKKAEFLKKFNTQP